MSPPTLPPASFAEITRLLANLPPLDALPQLTADSRVDVALYAGPHGDAATDWPIVLAPWHDESAPAARLFAAQPQLDLHLFELAGAPIGDSRAGPALTETQAAYAMAYGMMAAKQDLDLLILATVGDTETGAAASALAVIAALLKRAPDLLADDPDLITAAEAALAANRPQLTDPLTILAALGGHESCALLGAILAARLGGIPVWLEGLPALAAALVLARLAGTTEAARDLLGHARTTSLPAFLQPALSGVLACLTLAGDFSDAGGGLQSARALAQLRPSAAS